MKDQAYEHALETVIEKIVASYVARCGGEIDYEERPTARLQGTDPTKNGRPFDLLFEIGSRLLMLEVKVQIEPHVFNDLGEERRQMANLRSLWDKGVKIFYGFNLRIPCPDYWDKSQYPDKSIGITQIAGISPVQMHSYINNEIELSESENSLKVLIDSGDGGDALPKVLHDWKSSLYGEGYTSTYLLICYNIDLGQVRDISPMEFKELLKVFHYGRPGPRNVITEISNDIIEKVIGLREEWKRTLDQSQRQDNGLSL